MSNMKKVFTETLIDMLKTQTLNEITVTDIAHRCGVSRQAFYYYFDDIYDIVEWFFIEETDKVLMAYTDIDTWQTGYIHLMKWAKKNQTIIMNAYQSVQREYVEIFMNRVLYHYIVQVVEQESLGLSVTDEQCAYIANFYTLAINAITLDWIRMNMQEDPVDVAKKVNFMIEGDFKKALLKFQRLNQTKA